MPTREEIVSLLGRRDALGGAWWAIHFVFDYDVAQTAFRRLLSVPEIHGWWPYDAPARPETRLNVSDIKLNSPGRFDYHLLGAIRLPNGGYAACSIITLWDTSPGNAGASDASGIDEFPVVLHVNDHTCDQCYGRSTGEVPEEIRHRLDTALSTLIHDAARWVVSEVKTRMVYWGYEADPIEEDELTVSELRAGTNGYLLPEDHPARAKLPGTPFCPGYVIYHWNLSREYWDLRRARDSRRQRPR